MSPIPREGALVRKHVWMAADDWDWIEAHFGKESHKPIGTSRAVRLMIRKFRQTIERRAGGQRPSLQEELDD